MVTLSEGSSTLIEPAAMSTSKDGHYLISDLSAEFGISLRAIRFYCERRLISAVTAAGQARIFDLHNAQRLSLILKAKEFGLSLSEIGDLIDDRLDDRRGPALVISADMITHQISFLENQQAEMLAKLRKLLHADRVEDEHAVEAPARARSS